MTKEKTDLWQIAGPIGLCLSLVLAAKGSFPFDLCLVGCIGLILSARLRMQGCFYALILLLASGIFAHSFLELQHFWRLGVEASLACSFFITAFSFETAFLASSSLQTGLEAKESAIRNLEEEIAFERKQEADHQIAASKKIEELQKNLEELQTEKATLEILGDVLRKENSSHYAETQRLEEQILERKREVSELLLEQADLQKEIASIKQADISLENKSLLQQLNSARIEKEQARLINETLVRLHAKESLRVKELEENPQGPIEAVKQERDDCKQQLSQAEDKIQALTEVSVRYRQLQSQFEERNRILHETRKSLFKADTELQTIRIEKEERGLDSGILSREWLAELDHLTVEVTALRQENEELEAIVTHLTSSPGLGSPGSTIREAFSGKKKALPPGQLSLEETLREALVPKKRKRAKKNPQQDLLF